MRFPVFSPLRGSFVAGANAFSDEPICDLPSAGLPARAARKGMHKAPPRPSIDTRDADLEDENLEPCFEGPDYDSDSLESWILDDFDWEIEPASPERGDYWDDSLDREWDTASCATAPFGAMPSAATFCPVPLLC